MKDDKKVYTDVEIIEQLRKENAELRQQIATQNNALVEMKNAIIHQAMTFSLANR